MRAQQVQAPAAAVLLSRKRTNTMDKEQVADLFARGQDCSQVVLSYFAERLGISEDEANRISAGFGGGSGLGETCGAVIGALMALGLKYGNNGPDDMDNKGIMSGKRVEFIQEWLSRREHTLCRDFLGHDITQPGEFEKVIEEGTMFTFCPLLVLDAIDITEKLLGE